MQLHCYENLLLQFDSPGPLMYIIDHLRREPLALNPARQRAQSTPNKPKMKQFPLLGIYAIIALLPVPALSAQETVTQFFARAEQAYQSIENYRAVWRMNIGGKNSVATAYYKTPGRVLLEYNIPSKRFVLISNTQLAIYNPQNNILMTQPLEEAAGGPPSLSIMRRLYSMRYKYPSGSEPVTEEGINTPVIVLLLSPINSAARIDDIEVSFYAESLLMRRIRGRWYGSKVEYNFLDIRTNISLDDAIFELKDPPGAKEWANFLQD